MYHRHNNDNSRNHPSFRGAKLEEAHDYTSPLCSSAQSQQQDNNSADLVVPLLQEDYHHSANSDWDAPITMDASSAGHNKPTGSSGSSSSSNNILRTAFVADSRQSTNSSSTGWGVKISTAFFTAACVVLDNLPNKVAGLFLTDISAADRSKVLELKEPLHSIPLRRSVMIPLNYASASEKEHLRRVASAVADSAPSQNKRLIITPFDKSNVEHTQLLLQFWDSCQAVILPRGSLIPLIPEDLCSDTWKRFGFQQRDPGSDFRGGGYFALRGLLYFSETYPKVFSKFLRRSNEEYPFAISAINITMILLTLLQLNPGTSIFASKIDFESYSARTARSKLTRLLATQRTVQERERALHEVYCVCLCILDRIWSNGTKNLLEFNTVILPKAYGAMESAIKISDSIDALINGYAPELMEDPF